jgi:hypothetical protein
MTRTSVQLRRLGPLCLFLLAFPATTPAEKARKPTPPQPAQTYSLHETHAQEKVTIAAEPGDTKATAPNTRLDYFSHRMMPIRIIVTNDSDEPLTLDDARINFIAADNSTIHAATDDDLQRRMFTTKSATGTRHTIPLPIPVPITTGKVPVSKDILADMEDFGFKNTTVAPHATVAGYLFYDMQDLGDEPLAHATMELRKVRFATSNKALDSFEIPLRRATDSPPATNKP